MPSDRTLGDSRVLLFSQRNLHRPLFHALQYQFEDLLLTLDDVQVVAPLPHLRPALSSASRQVLNGGLRRAGRPRSSPPGNRPDLQPQRVTTEHDLFFAVIHDGYQLSYLRGLTGWRERCRRAVCVLMEVWSSGVARDADYYALLQQFDAVYAFTPAASARLVELGAPEPRYLSLGVDALQFAPGPRPPERVLDLYTYGRTSPSLHAQVLALVEQAGLTYVYDTTADASVPDHLAHRGLMANLMKRSRFFLAHRINDSPERQERTGGDESLSTRYFEATAGGAVVLGSEPRTPQFAEGFDWPDAVVPLPYDAVGGLADLLDDLTRQPERLRRARTAGVQAALLRHDMAYQWQSVLEDSGLSPAPGLLRRFERLEAAAEQEATVAARSC